MGAAVDMNAQKLKELKKLYIGLAEYYRVEITPGQLNAYAEDLFDLDLDLVAAAISRIRKTPGNVFFPLPAVIREAVQGSARDEAIEASNRIVQAMSRFGWNNPEGARNFIGELGWRVVEREGGWQSLCQRTTNEELPTLKAQWRELAAVTQRRMVSGIDNAAPQLPGQDKKQLTHIAGLIGKVVKSMAEPEEGK